MKVGLVAASLIFVLCFGCSKNGNTPPTAPGNPSDSLANIESYGISGLSIPVSIETPMIKLRFSDSMRSGNRITAPFTLSTNATLILSYWLPHLLSQNFGISRIANC
jgi:hypothetical protein